MKKGLPVLLVAAALMIGAPAQHVFAQDAASAQAGDETAANEAYKPWKAETDTAKKLDMGQKLVTDYFGSKASEAVGYWGMFDKGLSNDQKLAMSKTYYEAGKAAGKPGQYGEYALGNYATMDKDATTRLEKSREYLQQYPSGRYAEFIKTNIVPNARLELFQAAVKEKRYNDAIVIANEALAAGEGEFYYNYVLSDIGLRDVSANGANSQFVGKVTPWAERAIKYIESGQVPQGTDQAKWDQGKNAALSTLYKAKGLDQYYLTAKSTPASSAAFGAAIDAFKKAAGMDMKDPIPYYFLAQIYNVDYGTALKEYNAYLEKAEEEKTPEATEAALSKVNQAADQVIQSYIKVVATAGPSSPLTQQVTPPLQELWKFRHPDNPDAWQEEVNKMNGGAAPAMPSK